MNARSLVNHLVDYLRREVEAQRAVLACIERQEESIAKNDPAGLEEALEEAGHCAAAVEGLGKRRNQLLAELAGQWDLAEGALTLGGIARRLGTAGAELEARRRELRLVVAQVVKRNRRLSALIGMHQRIHTDLLQVLVGAERPEDVESGGHLVDAEA